MNQQDKQITQSYNQEAESYEKAWSSYLNHTHRHFLEELQTSPDDIILDASCGTGLLAQQLITAGFPFDKLVLNDIAEEMLQQAKDRLGKHPDISFSRQSVHDLEFKSQAFSKILCLNAFHNYFDQQKTINCFKDLLQSEGQLLLLDWNNSGLFRPVNWLIQQWVPEHIDTKSLPEMEKLLLEAGFQIHHKKQWYYKYWKFFFIKAEKSS